MSTPADPFAVVRTRHYVVLLVVAAVLGVVVSAGAYWFLKLVGDVQGWAYVDLPKGLGFHGTPPWWALLPLAVAGVIVGLTVRYLPGRGGHSPADGFKASGVALPAELPGIFLAGLGELGAGRGDRAKGPADRAGRRVVGAGSEAGPARRTRHHRGRSSRRRGVSRRWPRCSGRR
jgi:hypothetical protein